MTTTHHHTKKIRDEKGKMEGKKEMKKKKYTPILPDSDNDTGSVPFYEGWNQSSTFTLDGRGRSLPLIRPVVLSKSPNVETLRPLWESAAAFVHYCAIPT